MVLSSQIIENVKERSNLASDGDFLYSDSKILNAINTAFLNKVYPFFVEVSPSFYRVKKDFVIDDTLRVTIPPDSFNRQLYEVEYFSGSQQPQNLSIAHLEREAYDMGNAFYIEGNDVCLVGNNLVGKTLRFHYSKKVKTLISDTDSFLITDRRRGDGFIVENAPSFFTAGVSCYAQSEEDPFVVEEVTLNQVNAPIDGEMGHAYVFDTEISPNTRITLSSSGVAMPEVTDNGLNLIELETAMTFVLGDDTKKNIMLELGKSIEFARNSLKKRVTKETRSSTRANSLWDTSYHRSSEYNSRGY